MSNAVLAPIGFADYVAFEEASPQRHEYVAGYAYAMTGGTMRHNRIALNIATRLMSSLTSSGCQVFVNDVRLHLRSVNSAYYPDLLVCCGQAIADGQRHVEDATLIVEVSSDSTAGVDRREKRLAYQTLPGLRAYWVVSQAERQVEIFLRGDDGRWGSLTLVAADAELPMPELPGAPLKLAELYAGTDLA